MAKAHVITFTGALDMARANDFEDALTAVPRNAARIILDFSGVTHIESMMIGSLLLTKFRWDREGRRIATIVQDPNVLRVLTVLNVLHRLSVVSTMELALEAIGDYATPRDPSPKKKP